MSKRLVDKYQGNPSRPQKDFGIRPSVLIFQGLRVGRFGLIVIFDVEGVLVDGEFLPELARVVGKQREVTEITLRGIRGDIEWQEGLRQRMELLKGVDYEECVAVANRLPLMKGALEMSAELKKMDCIMVGVSGGFSLLTDRVKEELNLDQVFSNQLVFHERRLIGYGLLVNANKTQIMKTAFGSMLDTRKKVAVVDGANDLELFNIADLKVAFNAQRVVVERADVSVSKKDLRAIPELVRKLR